MDFLTIIVLAMGALTSLILFGMIYFGAKNSKQMDTLGKNVNSSTSEMKNNLEKVLNSIESNQEQQENILSRLQNLETIVTSEAWEAINKNEDPEYIDLLLKDDEEEEISSEEKTQNIAKRIKH
ncbi:MAG: hypothetical protein JXR20_08340 [Balneola sp.]